MIKFFSLQILVTQVVLIENPLDDIASPLGISSNMLIKAAITKISFFSIFSIIKHASNKRKVSITHVFMVKGSDETMFEKLL